MNGANFELSNCKNSQHRQRQQYCFKNEVMSALDEDLVDQ